ncbi:MAG: lipid A export permease/ATP-binding protein MsbA [Betaproteobacteria bacterium]|nr:lipid A export permease/ATP-binding protein MsbA [Betaproteobacteria bacterium]
MPSLLERFKRLAPYFRTSRTGLVATIFGATLMALTEPMLAELMKRLLDDGFTGKQIALWMVPAAIIALFALRSVAGFLAQYGLAWAAQRAVLQLRQAMFARLVRAQPALFAEQTASGLTNSLVYEVQAGVQILTNALLTLVRDSLTLVALLAYLLWLNWQLTLFVGVLFPAVAVVMRKLGARLHRLTVQSQQATDELAYVVEENVLAWRIVRLQGAEAAQAKRFTQRAEALRRLMLKVVVAGATMTPVTQMLAAVALSAVIALALWQSGTGGATVGGFVAFISAMLMLVAPLKHLADVMAPITRGLAAVERGMDLAERAPAEVGGSHRPVAGTASAEPTRARGEITFDDVALRYNDDAAPALAGVTLHVQPGETVALVGPSGAGKTTLVNLLPRFLEPTAGRIRLDGVELREWDIATLRRQFAFVSQDVVLFNDTIAANVSLGAEAGEGGEGRKDDAAAPRARIRAALAAAALLDFVDALPQGLDSVIGHNGSELSGGQRQRLAIARAIYKDAPVLILDEATSALDSESERAVQAALERLMQGRTTLVIAHRLSTIEHADRVVALEGGRLAEQGTHAALLAAGGLYARLHAMQFKT